MCTIDALACRWAGGAQALDFAPPPVTDLIWLGPLRQGQDKGKDTGQHQEPLLLPLALEAVAAGFPSPADDYVEAAIDLNTVLIPRPSSTLSLIHI